MQQQRGVPLPAVDLSAVRTVTIPLASAVILAVGGMAIYRLPYRFPPTQPMCSSESYALGFDNRVALLAALLTLAALSLLRFLARWNRAEPIDRLILVRREHDARLSMPKSLLWTMLALHAAWATILFRAVPHLDMYWEPFVLLPRIILGMQHHLVPCRDISWFYGPGLYYLPQLFIAVVSLFHGSSDLGYFLCYVTCASLGIWSLFVVVDALAVKSVLRIAIFVVLALIVDDVTLGLQYTLLRTATPFALLLYVHRKSVRLPATPDAWGTVQICGLALLAALTMLLISSEVGTVYVVTQVAYFAHRAFFVSRHWLWAIAATVAAPLAIIVALPDYFDIIHSVARGGMNIPPIIAPYTLVYLLSLAWVVPILLCSCAVRRPADHVPLNLGWALLVLGMVPAVLGQCITDHIMVYGLGAFLMTMTVLARCRPRALAIYAVLLLVVYGLIGRITWYAGNSVQVQYLNEELTGEKLDLGPSVTELSEGLDLDRFRSVAMPFDIQVAMRRHLIDSRKLFDEYHTCWRSVRSLDDVQRRINDIQKADVVLVPRPMLDIMEMSDEIYDKFASFRRAEYEKETNRRFGLYAFRPVQVKCRQAGVSPNLELARGLRGKLKVVGGNRFYVLLKKAPAGESSPAGPTATP
jgi:hypothetical protein